MNSGNGRSFKSGVITVRDWLSGRFVVLLVLGVILQAVGLCSLPFHASHGATHHKILLIREEIEEALALWVLDGST